MDVVDQAWREEVYGSPLQKFHMKLKNTCKNLSAWSKNTIGNIFDNVKVLEGRVAELEELSILDNSATNRAELN